MRPDQPASEAYAYPLLIRHLFHTACQQYPQREIVYAGRRRHSYTEFRNRVGRLASALDGLGVKQGDTVAVMDWDSHRYLECFFAVPMLGSVLHTVNIRLSPEQILYTINHASDDWILVHADFLPVLESIIEQCEKKPGLVVLHDDDIPESSLEFAGEYEALLENGDEKYEFSDFDENTRATTFYTTGTTGNPKGVFYSHRQLVLHTLGVGVMVTAPAGHGRLHRDDVYMPITPMFHVHAWGIPYVATMLGVKQVYPGRYEPDRLLRTISEENVTYSHCVPTILHMLMTSDVIDDVDLSNWKVIIGGSALPRGLADAALARGIDLFSGYGMSETGPVLTVSQYDGDVVDVEAQADARCRAGRAVPLVDLRIVDEQMNDKPWDGTSTGEIVVRAPWTTQGYFGNREGSDELWRGGYLHTGDIGSIDPAGFLRITDRLKDVIKSGGEWISSVELEDIVSTHTAVSEVAAIGIPDTRWGERPLVLVVPKPDVQIDVAEIRQLLQEQIDAGVLSKWAMPEKIEITDNIARTSVGKINKKELRSTYG